jgi:hypothetical protein
LNTLYNVFVVGFFCWLASLPSCLPPPSFCPSLLPAWSSRKLCDLLSGRPPRMDTFDHPWCRICVGKLYVYVCMYVCMCVYVCMYFLCTVYCLLHYVFTTVILQAQYLMDIVVTLSVSVSFPQHLTLQKIWN